VGDSFIYLQKALDAGRRAQNNEFRYSFNQRNFDTYFTAAEIVDAIAKWSMNQEISLIISSKTKTQFTRLTDFYMESRTQREKESAIKALSTLSSVPELNKVMRENRDLIQCFQNDVHKIDSDKLRESLAEIKFHNYSHVSVNGAYSIQANNVDLFLLEFNDAFKVLRNIQLNRPDSVLFKAQIQEFSNKIQQDIIKSSTSLDNSEKLIENYFNSNFARLLKEFDAKINRNSPRLSIRPNEMPFLRGEKHLETFNEVIEKYLNNGDEKVKCVAVEGQLNKLKHFNDSICLEEIFKSKSQAKTFLNCLKHAPNQMKSILDSVKDTFGIFLAENESIEFSAYSNQNLSYN